MANEAERVVVELIAKMDGFDGKVKQGASSFGGAMKTIEASGARAEAATTRSLAKIERSMGRAGQASRNLGFQISDISTQLAAGTSPFLILAQQGPQVANALDGAKGKVGQFATFLSGPWGAALLGATTLLGVFGSKLLESGEEAKKSSNANELFADKLDRTKHSLDEVIAAVKEYNDEQAKARETTLGMAQAAAIAAAKNIEEEISIRKKLDARLADRKLSASIAAEQGEGEALATALQRVQGVEAEIAANEKKLRDLEVQARASVINVATEIAKLDSDPTEKIKLGFTLLRTEARQTIRDVDALAKRLAALNKQEEAALARQREAARPGRKAAPGLPAVTGAEIARALGAPITSGARTPAQNKAAGGAANSYHLSGQAIDIPLTVNGKPLTKAGIRAALEPLGVQIKELLGPGDKGHSDHFHIAFDKKRLGPDQVAGRASKAAEQAERLAEAEVARKQRVASEEASLDERILGLKAELTASAEQDAALQLERIQVAQDAYNAELESLHAAGKIDDVEAYILRLKGDQAADLQRQIVDRQTQQRQRQDALAVAQGLIDNDLELLRGDEALATTQKERREIALAILDAEGEILRLKLEDVLASDTATEAQKEIARRRLEQLDQEQANAREGVRRDTASPLESYMGDIQKTAGDLDTAFQEIAVGGLKAVSDGLVDAIVNFRSLGDVARSVLQMILSQLLQILIQMIIMKALKAILGVPFAGGGEVGGHSLGGGAGMANGGRVGFPGGGPVIGAGTATSDSIPAMLSNGEFVIRKKAVDGLGLQFLNEINRTGALPGLSGGGLIRAVSPSNAVAAPGGTTPGGGMDENAVRRIEAAVERGAAAQLPVNLYPTLDPKRAMERMLSDPGAQRMLFGFMSDNSGKINTQLRR